MDTFVYYSLDEPKIATQGQRLRLRRRPKHIQVQYILGLRDVPDEGLIRAILDSGIALTRKGQVLSKGDVLDLVIKERS